MACTLSAPWDIYYAEVKAFFAKDDEVKVIFDRENLNLMLYVDGESKASALSDLLEGEKTWGSATLKVTVIPSNTSSGTKHFVLSKIESFAEAFLGNNAVEDIITIKGIMSNPMTYIVFKKEVVQYFTDDLGDYHGVRSTLYQEIAKEIFGEHEGIFFCTDTSDTVWL